MDIRVNLPWPLILKLLLWALPFVPIFVADCFSMVMCSAQLPMALMLLSIIYKHVRAERQMICFPNFSSLAQLASLETALSIKEFSDKSEGTSVRKAELLLCRGQEVQAVDSQYHGQSPPTLRMLSRRLNHHPLRPSSSVLVEVVFS